LIHLSSFCLSCHAIVRHGPPPEFMDANARAMAGVAVPRLWFECSGGGGEDVAGVFFLDHGDYSEVGALPSGV